MFLVDCFDLSIDQEEIKSLADEDLLLDFAQAAAFVELRLELVERHAIPLRQLPHALLDLRLLDLDVFGARDSALGRGKIDNNLLGLEFRFDSKEGGLTNKFTFDWQNKTWTSLIRQQEKSEWKTFAEEKWTRVEDKK